MVRERATSSQREVYNQPRISLVKFGQPLCYNEKYGRMRQAQSVLEGIEQGDIKPETRWCIVL